LSINESSTLELLQSKFTPDQIKILNVAVSLFKITVPSLKDERGYNRIDACLFKYMLIQGFTEFTIYNLEWIRRKLLCYFKQIRQLGVSPDFLQRPIADKAVYGWKVLADSRFTGVKLVIDKEAHFTFKWYSLKWHKGSQIQVVLERSEGLKMLTEQGSFCKTLQDAQGCKIQVLFCPNDCEKLLTKFGITGITGQ
jgi:hypothetical protein